VFVVVREELMRFDEVARATEEEQTIRLHPRPPAGKRPGTAGANAGTVLRVKLGQDTETESRLRAYPKSGFAELTKVNGPASAPEAECPAK
jgi:hypothetical protein